MHNVFIRASDYCDSNQLMQLYDGHRNVLSWDDDFDVLHFLTKLCWLHSNISKIGDCFSKSTMISMMKKSSRKGSLEHLDARSCISFYWISINYWMVFFPFLFIGFCRNDQEITHKNYIKHSASWKCRYITVTYTRTSVGW